MTRRDTATRKIVHRHTKILAPQAQRGRSGAEPDPRSRTRARRGATLFIVTFVLSFSPPGPGGAPGDTVTVSPARSTRPESDLRHYGVWCMNGVWRLSTTPDRNEPKMSLTHDSHSAICNKGRVRWSLS